jgi:hypothetical protein
VEEQPNATLDRWRPFLRAPQTLAFPRLALMGRDHAPLIVEGSGEIRMPSLNLFEYTLRGTPTDIAYALRSLRKMEEDRYDGLARFRLVGTDAGGREWTFGYTNPSVEVGDSEEWTFAGRLDGLGPGVWAGEVAADAGTEAIFAIPADHPAARAMGAFVRSEAADGQPTRSYELDVLGTPLHFCYSPSEGALSITIPCTAAFPLTFTENWLGEPLRVLFGQLIYPRLVARNFGDGRAYVSILRSPPFARNAGWASLWPGDASTLKKADFWRLYADLMAFIANARAPDGHLNWEANQVTQFYVEIIQAAQGTRWVWALTFASCIEGLVRMLTPRDTRHPKADDAAIAELVTHIEKWDGDDRLKKIATGAVKRSVEFPMGQILKRLQEAGVVSIEQCAAWERIRNSVMHGSLVSPYSSAEEDARLLALSEMMHALTREVVRRAAKKASGESPGPA